jgi:hypothetical protein
LVLYDSRSDEIHRFDGVTAEVFEELQSGPRSPAELAAAIGGRLDVIVDDELSRLIAEILRILSSKSIAAPLE